ncbi:DUF1573 domain-containing protein [Pontiellaceae bacterium B1224]|nr:DUF1573 domain-containing protein [Pontiellaceae bacterium B1224]
MVSGIRILSLCFLALFTANSTVFAELTWEKKVVGVKPHPLQTSTTIDFKFTNTGDEAITLTDLRPGCGCISGTSEKKKYAPGETGVIRMAFEFGKRTGPHRKSLEVRTSDPSDKSTKLYISANIPETYRPSVPSLKWAVGDEPVSKSFRLINRHKLAIKLIKADAPDDRVEIELKPIEEGHEYELVVTPSSSSDMERAMIPITIYPEKPNELAEVKAYIVYVLFK